MSLPSMKIRPDVGVSKPASILRSVVLPQPEPPSRAKSSPLAMSIDTFLTAGRPAKVFVTFSIFTEAFVSACSLPCMMLFPGVRFAMKREGRASTRLHIRPDAGQRAFLFFRLRLGDEETVHRLGIRI